MQDFQFYTPTMVYFGKHMEQRVGSVLKEHGYSKVLLHYGQGSVIKSGLLDSIKTSLDESHIAWIELGGVEPNPKIGLIREGIELSRRESVDMILAVGGGSVIDSAKGIALGLANGKDSVQMQREQLMPTHHFPIAVVLTISSAGSEMSSSHVVTDPETHTKRGLSHDVLRPDFAFLNPELTFSVSKYQTACGIVDTMMHTLERYFTEQKDAPLTDTIAEAILVSVKEAGIIAINNPSDYQARATLMWASSLSHNGLTGCGKTAFFPAHKIEHDISGLFDHIAHGAGLAVIFPAWAKYEYNNDVEKFARLAVKVWDIAYDEEHPEVTALRGIEAMSNFFSAIGMPRTLEELGVPKESWETLASMTTNNGSSSLKSYRPLGKREILEIYHLAT